MDLFARPGSKDDILRKLKEYAAIGADPHSGRLFTDASLPTARLAALPCQGGDLTVVPSSGSPGAGASRKDRKVSA